MHLEQLPQAIKACETGLQQSSSAVGGNASLLLLKAQLLTESQQFDLALSCYRYSLCDCCMVAAGRSISTAVRVRFNWCSCSQLTMTLFIVAHWQLNCLAPLSPSLRAQSAKLKVFFAPWFVMQLAFCAAISLDSFLLPICRQTAGVSQPSEPHDD